MVIVGDRAFALVGKSSIFRERFKTGEFLAETLSRRDILQRSGQAPPPEGSFGALVDRWQLRTGNYRNEFSGVKTVDDNTIDVKELSDIYMMVSKPLRPEYMPTWIQV